MLQTVLLGVMALFPISEVVLALGRRANAATSRDEDRGSMRLLWVGIGLGVSVAIGCQWFPGARMHLPRGPLQAAALVCLLGGLAIRWAAILTLGRLFTVDVAIHADHQVIDTGLYRFVRHPSYAGLLMAFLGLGLWFANWLSLASLLVPIAAVVANRIVREEQALLAALGPPYADYCSRTWRLLPGVF